MSCEAKMTITRATTPRHIFEVGAELLEDIAEFQLTYKQGNEIVLEFGLNDAESTEDGVITYHLTQEQANLFRARTPVQIQARILTLSGEVVPSYKITADVEDVLHDNILGGEEDEV